MILASAEAAAFRITLCGWLAPDGLRELKSFAELKGLIADWAGQEVSIGAWQTARAQLYRSAKNRVDELVAQSERRQRMKAQAQHDAARLRTVDELGRLLLCFEPDTDDLNGKFHRLASDQTPTAQRLQNVFSRLEGYPSWEPAQIADLRAFRSELTPNQVKTRLTGRELDAAVVDPRWATLRQCD